MVTGTEMGPSEGVPKCDEMQNFEDVEVVISTATPAPSETTTLTVNVTESPEPNCENHALCTRVMTDNHGMCLVSKFKSGRKFSKLYSLKLMVKLQFV